MESWNGGGRRRPWVLAVWVLVTLAGSGRPEPQRP
jgi:hypothetical protein